ncbi:MAG: serine/threonine protein kinase [Acidobacteria bacterium]|nr:serine/threonine protein kinase [Acidobacteriota bacterium]
MPRNDEPTRRLGPNETQEIIPPHLDPVDRLDPLVGEMVGGRYQLVAPLGRGGFGHVYRARDQKLDRIVAIKLMHDAGSGPDHEARQRVLRETRANARLQHPHIVTLHDAGEDPRGLYLVLEYVAGTSLEEVLAAGPLPPERAAEVLRECAEALAAAHSQGIVHRDIKPANILIDDSGRVKIADFGIARLLGESHTTDRGTIVGTPNYMAPEQIDGRGVGPAADIFELGCVAYEMISGRPPFHGGTPSEVIGRILRGVPDPLPPLQASMQPMVDLVTQMLLKSPADRPLPTSIIAAIDAWRHGHRDSRLHAAPVAFDWRIALGAVAVVALVAAIFAVRSWKQSDEEIATGPPPRPTIVELAAPERSAPSESIKVSVTFSNRDNVFRFLDFLGRDRHGVTRLDDLTLQIEGNAEDVAKRSEQARIVDSMPGQRFALGHNVFRDGVASDQAVTLAFERITADELVETFAWSGGWPVVQRHDFAALAARHGPLRVEARAQPWDLVVSKVLDTVGAEAVRFESTWLVVPKGAPVREPLRLLGVYQDTVPLAVLERKIEEGDGAVVLHDELSLPQGLIIVAPSRSIDSIKKRFADGQRDDWRLVEPNVFAGEPMTLRVQGVSCAELAALAGGSWSGCGQQRVTATIADVPKDEVLAIAGTAGESPQLQPPQVDFVVRAVNRPASFYAPLAVLAGEEGALVPDDRARQLTIRGATDVAASLRRVIAAIDTMLAPR